MRFVLCVRLGVDLHVRLTEEGGRTHPAPTGGETQTGGQDGRTTREEGRKDMNRGGQTDNDGKKKEERG